MRNVSRQEKTVLQGRIFTRGEESFIKARELRMQKFAYIYIQARVLLNAAMIRNRMLFA